MRALLINAVALNGGDGAIMLAIREHVRAVYGADADFVVHDPQAAVAAPLYPELEFGVPASRMLRHGPRRRGLGRVVRAADRWRWLLAARLRSSFPAATAALLRDAERRKLDEYASASLVISTGGTYLVEQYDLGRRIFEFQLVRALRRPLVLYTQSLGPFRQPRVRRALRRALGGAELVLLRDERSRRHALDLGLPAAKLAVVADVVFTFARDTEPEPPPVLRRVAVSVREWSHFRGPGGEAAYVAAIRALVASLVRDHGADVTFVSTCQGVPAYRTDDSRYAARIIAGLDPDLCARVEVDHAFRRPEALIDDLAGFDAVVATRMHVAIMALCAGTPVLPISYEFKTRELFTRLGMERFVRDIDDVNADDMPGLFAEFWESREAWREPLREAVAKERALADEARERLAAGMRAR